MCTTDLILYIPNRKVIFLYIYEFNIHLPRRRASVNRKLYILYKTKTSSHLQKIVQKSCIKFNELAQWEHDLHL